MKARRTATIIATALLLAGIAGSALVLRKLESVRGSQATLEEVLYLPSGKVLKRASLGYSSLLADIYWTRAVQYFGSKHIRTSMRYDLLYPLLDITTDLDPHLMVAYQAGSIFLSQQPPEGAGQPDKAVALVEKGIRENPTYWRLYFTLGFIHYLDRRDYRAAQQAFEKGSEIPGALPWMKVMAARMAENAEDISTALNLWRAVYETTQEPTTRDTALKHIASLQAEAEMIELTRRVNYYREKTGTPPSSWSELIRAGMLPGVPVDPSGAPFELLPDGRVKVRDQARFPFLGEFQRRQAK
jgi:tetratricopeptide (TPR) repeat protein